MRHLTPLLLALTLLAAGPASAAEPDYKTWQELLSRHYNPAKGMNYKALKADKANLDKLRRQMATVDAASLSRPEQLAYWINLYNINVVGIVADNYPVESIRDISTDPIVRLNVFKKPSVRIKGGTISLDAIEHEKIQLRGRELPAHPARALRGRPRGPAARRPDAQVPQRTPRRPPRGG